MRGLLIMCPLGSGHPAHLHQLGLPKLWVHPCWTSWATPMHLLVHPVQVPATLSARDRNTRQGLVGFVHRHQSLLGAPESPVTADPHQTQAPGLLTPPTGTNSQTQFLHPKSLVLGNSWAGIPHVPSVPLHMPLSHSGVSELKGAAPSLISVSAISLSSPPSGSQRHQPRGARGGYSHGEVVHETLPARGALEEVVDAALDVSARQQRAARAVDGDARVKAHPWPWSEVCGARGGRHRGRHGGPGPRGSGRRDGSVERAASRATLSQLQRKGTLLG